MTSYGIQNSPLTNTIYVGQVNEARTEFTHKEDLTDAAIYEVAKHIHRAYDGSMSYIHPDGEAYIITVIKDQYAKF